jgi:DNA primase
MLDKALRTAITPIKDASIKRHYGEILNDMRWELFQSKRTQSGEGSASGLADLMSASPVQEAPSAPSYGGYEDFMPDMGHDSADERSYDADDFAPQGQSEYNSNTAGSDAGGGKGKSGSYGSGFDRKKFDKPRTRGEWDPKTRSFRQPAVPVETTKSSSIAASDESYADVVREAVILATLLRNPGLALGFLSQLEALHPTSEDHATILLAILSNAEELDPTTLAENVREVCGQPALDRLMAHPHVKISPPVRRPDMDIAQMCLTEELAKLKARRGYSAELNDGILDMVEAGDEKVTWRLAQAAEARNKATKAEAEDRAEYDIADNGAEMKREERRSFHDLLNSLSADPARKTKPE